MDGVPAAAGLAFAAAFCFFRSGELDAAAAMVVGVGGATRVAGVSISFTAAAAPAIFSMLFLFAAVGFGPEELRIRSGATAGTDIAAAAAAEKAAMDALDEAAMKKLLSDPCLFKSTNFPLTRADTFDDGAGNGNGCNDDDDDDDKKEPMREKREEDEDDDDDDVSA